MRYLRLLPLLLLSSCAALPLSPGELAESGGNILGNVLTGNYVGAAGQTLDLALILLGYKTMKRPGIAAFNKMKDAAVKVVRKAPEEAKLA